MARETIAELEEILTTATAGLAHVTSKKMFGCHALWVNENVFALVWKHGRIGFKLPDSSQYEGLLKTWGAEPWKAGPMTMAHWVLVPESFHGKKAELKKWAGKAHELCSKLDKKATKKPGKSSVTKAATKKVAKAPAKKSSRKK